MNQLRLACRLVVTVQLAMSGAACSSGGDQKPIAPSAPATAAASGAAPAVSAASPDDSLSGSLALQTRPLAGVSLGVEKPTATFVNGRLFVVESGSRSDLCDLTTWNSVLSLPPGLSGWTASADGRWFAANDTEHTVIVDAQSGREKTRLAKREGAKSDSLALSAAGESLLVLASPSLDKLQAEVWETGTAAPGPARRLDYKQALPMAIGVFLPSNRAALWLESGNGPHLMVEGGGPLGAPRKTHHHRLPGPPGGLHALRDRQSQPAMRVGKGCAKPARDSTARDPQTLAESMLERLRRRRMSFCRTMEGVDMAAG